MDRELTLTLDRPPTDTRVPGPTTPRYVVSYTTGDDLASTIRDAVRRVERAGARVIRVHDRDMVTLADIGAHLGASREIVRQWTTGKQGPGGFPPPLNPHAHTRFWSLAEVTPWLTATRKHSDRTEHTMILAAAGLVIRLRNLLPYLADPTPLWDLIDPTGEKH
jgi:hypothetical protein